LLWPCWERIQEFRRCGSVIVCGSEDEVSFILAPRRKQFCNLATILVIEDEGEHTAK